VQVDGALDNRLQLLRGRASQRDAIAVAEFNHCVAMNVCGDKGL